MIPHIGWCLKTGGRMNLDIGTSIELTYPGYKRHVLEYLIRRDAERVSRSLECDVHVHSFNGIELEHLGVKWENKGGIP